MDTSTPLESRIAAVNEHLFPTYTQIEDSLRGDVEFVQSTAEMFVDTPLTSQEKDALLQSEQVARLELANKRIEESHALWVSEVSLARSRWGNDAVDAVLKMLAKR